MASRARHGLDLIFPLHTCILCILDTCYWISRCSQYPHDAPIMHTLHSRPLLDIRRSIFASIGVLLAISEYFSRAQPPFPDCFTPSAIPGGYPVLCYSQLAFSRPSGYPTYLGTWVGRYQVHTGTVGTSKRCRRYTQSKP